VRFSAGVAYRLSAVAAAVFLAAAAGAAGPGEAALAAGRYDEAAAWFEGACARDPADFAARFYLAYCYGARGRWEECRRTLETCAALRDDRPEVYYNLGVALDHRGAYEAAAAAFEESLLLEPGWAAANYNCGVSFCLAGRPVRAIKYLREARALAPAETDVLYYLALSYEDIDRRVALERWRDYLKRAAGDPAEAPYVTEARRRLEALSGGRRP
jgi:Flp pilus assembly protein TadD